jgi:chemotaxis protein MotB
MSGCVSEDTYRAQLGRYDELAARDGACRKELAEARDRAAALALRLEQSGVKLTAAGSEAGELRKALADHRHRAQVLERIRMRLVELQKKLQALTDIGLDVTIRYNRLIISLPGDVLFDSGKDELREEGKKVLDKVAEVIRSDDALAKRYYQVAGHTDHTRLRGKVQEQFRDNWGLSLMRARRVLLYLIDAEDGGLPANRWSASGFADTDPIASNDSDPGRQKNRRCELVVVPSAEEVLDLKAIAQ